MEKLSPRAADALPPREELIAEVLEQVRRDAKAGRFEAWGSSTLIDEFTGVPTIDRELCDTLHAAAGLPGEFPVGNAGLLHVYGYWFSDVPTPFGLKRDRWVHGDLAATLGRPRDEFLLGERPDRTLLERVADATLPVLHAPSPDAVTAEATVGDRHSRVVLHPNTATGGQALVYGVSGGARRAAHELLMITAFPFSGDPSGLAREFVRDPRPRWNAVIDR